MDRVAFGGVGAKAYVLKERVTCLFMQLLLRGKSALIHEFSMC